jgi:hypothetical protein
MCRESHIFFNLLTPGGADLLFQRAARTLLPDGAFVIEAFVVGFDALAGGKHLSTSTADTDYGRLVASSHNPVTQRVNSQSVFRSEEGVPLYPVQTRYA